ncbi:hypothetical protein M8J77_015188 [Diaphorina citri]|nr:hypothetical protein M8J77_015188 [Diaphorina citri]
MSRYGLCRSSALLAFRAYAPDVPSRTRARVWHLGPMPQTVSNLPLQPSQSSGALWLKTMCDALWLTAMCDALWLTTMCDALWLTAVCDALWLTAMCDALWLTAMCDALWLTAMGLISLHISSLATMPAQGTRVWKRRTKPNVPLTINSLDADFSSSRRSTSPNTGSLHRQGSTVSNLSVQDPPVKLTPQQLGVMGECDPLFA